MKKWILPIEYNSDKTNSLLSIFIFFVSIFLCYILNVVMDGCLDLHYIGGASDDIHLKEHFVMAIINILCMVIPLWLLGYAFNKNIRVVDVLNAVIISRWPLVLSIPVVQLMGQNDTVIALEQQLSQFVSIDDLEVDTGSMVAFGMWTILSLILLVTHMVIFFLNYKTAVNMKKITHIILFFLIVVLAEIFSKLLITVIL